MTRLPNWRARLNRYIAAARKKPFRYGEHDCVAFAAGAVAATTGIHFLRERGIGYRTRIGGLRQASRQGYADHLAFLRAHLPEIAPAEARFGDLVVIDHDGATSLGVVGGSFALAPIEPAGIAAVPLLSIEAGGHVRCAFRV